MIFFAPPGTPVRVHYRKRNSDLPLHGKRGTIIACSTGKPRNHLVLIEGKRYSVPCGNLVRDDGK